MYTATRCSFHVEWTKPHWNRRNKIKKSKKKHWNHLSGKVFNKSPTYTHILSSNDVYVRIVACLHFFSFLFCAVRFSKEMHFAAIVKLIRMLLRHKRLTLIVIARSRLLIQNVYAFYIFVFRMAFIFSFFLMLF